MEICHKYENKWLWGVVLGLLMLVVLCCRPVNADSILDEIDWEKESVDIAGDYAEDTEYSLLRGNHLNYGRATITKRASNEVGLSGTTMAHHDCDKLYLYLYLERKVNGTYSTYKYWTTTDTNVYELDRSISILVPSGYYYRLRGYHSAVDNGMRESKTTLTNGIYIG